MSKRNPAARAGQRTDGESRDDRWREDADKKLAGIYQAALEEPIPDDMLRLVRMIGAQTPRKS